MIAIGNSVIFYQQMNKDKEVNRWGEWSHHRDEVQRLIDTAISNKSHFDNVVYLGAGNCQDVDLEYWLDVFRHVSLIDIDEQSMKLATVQLDAERSSRVSLFAADLSMLDQLDFYKRFEDILAVAGSAESIVSLLSRSSMELEHCEVLASHTGSYSVVISSAVYTQLFYIYALKIFADYADNYSKEEIQQIIGQLIRISNRIIVNYNNLMCSLAREGGYIVVWSDVMKMEPDGSFYAGLLSLDEATRMNYLFQCVGDSGIENALLGLEDMYGRLTDKVFQYWNWKFSAEKHYLTFGVAGHVDGVPRK